MRGLMLIVLAEAMLRAQTPAPATRTCAQAITDAQIGVRAAVTDYAADLKKASDAPAKAQAVTQLKSTIALRLRSAEAVAPCVAELGAPKAEAAANNTVVVAKRAVESKRVDEMVGAPSSAAGSTSAVTSGSRPTLAGLALEDGAITKSISGATTTITANPYKIIASLVHDGGATIDAGDPGSRFLRRLSLSMTLNTQGTQGSAQTSISTVAGVPFKFLGEFKQASNATVHFDIVNDRDQNSSGRAKAFQNLYKDKTSERFMASAHTFLDTYRLKTQPAFVKDLDTVMDSAQKENISETDSKDLDDKVEALLRTVVSDSLQTPGAADAARSFLAISSTFKDEQKKTYDKFAHSPIFSVEYSLDRPPMVMAQTVATATTATVMQAGVDPSALHTLRLIHQNQFIGQSEYTVNASASFFQHKTAGMPDRWRDLQISGKIDIPFAGVANLVSKGTLTFSGLYEKLHQMPLGVDLKLNGVSVTQPGTIGLFQARYSITLPGNSGVSVPISFTVSNRTELIKEKEVRGNIGLTFDLDKLFLNK